MGAGRLARTPHRPHRRPGPARPIPLPGAVIEPGRDRRRSSRWTPSTVTRWNSSYPVRRASQARLSHLSQRPGHRPGRCSDRSR